MWGKIALGATVVGAGIAARLFLIQYSKKLQERGDRFLLNAHFQDLEIDDDTTAHALIVNIPNNIKAMLPIMAPKNRKQLRPYTRVLNHMYFRGQITEGGVYGVELRADGEYHLYSPYPIQKNAEVSSEVPAQELVEKPQS